MIRTLQLAASAGMLTGTFEIEKIATNATAKGIESVSLDINKTQFVSGGDNIAVADLSPLGMVDMNNVSLKVSIPSIVPTQNYVFARIGLKMAGLVDRIFSPVQKIAF